MQTVRLRHNTGENYWVSFMKEGCRRGGAGAEARAGIEVAP